MNGLHHCIVRFDHDATRNDVLGFGQCYADTDLRTPGAEPLNDPPAEGPDGVPGPPPPRPYTTASPAVLAGTYDPDRDRLELSGCFSNVGTLGPHVIAEVIVILAKDQLANRGEMAGEVFIHGFQATGPCQAKVPKGQDPEPLPINLYPAGPGGVAAPWRTSGDADFDDDGCTDYQELGPDRPPACGDDPYNPLDSNQPDFGGAYLLLGTAVQADVCWNASPTPACDAAADGTVVPGFYYGCLADIQQSGADLSAPIYCYVDAPSVVVNPEAAGGVTSCPPAAPGFCGDGLAGPAPPGRTAAGGPILLGDVDDGHAVLGGAYNPLADTITLSGCMEDRDGAGPLGNVYWQMVWDASTGQGTAFVAANESLDGCLGGTPVGGDTIELEVARQSTTAEERDTDSDGCPDKLELSDDESQGGLRDPQNHYDYMDATKNGEVRIDDILAVVGQYFLDDVGQPDLKSQTDRTAVIGGNDWNLGPPNGQQRVDDILAQVKQYFHDC